MSVMGFRGWYTVIRSAIPENGYRENLLCSLIWQKSKLYVFVWDAGEVT